MLRGENYMPLLRVFRILTEYMRCRRLFGVLVVAVPGGSLQHLLTEQDGTVEHSEFDVCLDEMFARSLR